MGIGFQRGGKQRGGGRGGKRGGFRDQGPPETVIGKYRKEY